MTTDSFTMMAATFVGVILLPSHDQQNGTKNYSIAKLSGQKTTQGTFNVSIPHCI